jgi:hypothetical protein
VNREGGEFETLAVWLSRHEYGQLSSFEYFEVADLDVARARFEELSRTTPQRE